MHDINDLEEIFNTTLQKDLKTLQFLAETTTSKVKLLTLLYMSSLFLVTVSLVYYMTSSWQAVAYILVAMLVAIPIKIYLHPGFFMLFAFIMTGFIFENDLPSLIFIDALILFAFTVHTNIVKEKYTKRYYTQIIKPLIQHLSTSLMVMCLNVILKVHGFLKCVILY